MCVHGPCRTHGIKSIRNQLYSPKDGGFRYGMNHGGGFILFDLVRDVLKRDNERRSRDVATIIALKTEMLELDGYSKMNANFTKQVFS
jgi:hypothetical protein